MYSAVDREEEENPRRKKSKTARCQARTFFNFKLIVLF